MGIWNNILETTVFKYVRPGLHEVDKEMTELDIKYLKNVFVKWLKEREQAARRQQKEEAKKEAEEAKKEKAYY